MKKAGKFGILVLALFLSLFFGIFFVGSISFASAACGDCGVGLANNCDFAECTGLGNCIFNSYDFLGYDLGTCEDIPVIEVNECGSLDKSNVIYSINQDLVFNEPKNAGGCSELDSSSCTDSRGCSWNFGGICVSACEEYATDRECMANSGGICTFISSGGSQTTCMFNGMPVSSCPDGYFCQIGICTSTNPSGAGEPTGIEAAPTGGPAPPITGAVIETPSTCNSYSDCTYGQTCYNNICSNTCTPSNPNPQCGSGEQCLSLGVECSWSVTENRCVSLSSCAQRSPDQCTSIPECKLKSNFCENLICSIPSIADNCEQTEGCYSNMGTCINIEQDLNSCLFVPPSTKGIIIEGNGHSITGNNINSLNGLSIKGNNVKLQNITLKSLDTGLYLESPGVNIINAKLENNNKDIKIVNSNITFDLSGEVLKISNNIEVQNSYLKFENSNGSLEFENPVSFIVEANLSSFLPFVSIRKNKLINKVEIQSQAIIRD